jgi:CHAT domain-containing protein
MYLELNLIERAGGLANKALDQFRDLGMKYETAKALANAGLVAARQADTARALELFEQARRLFRAERNRVWPAMLDLHSGLVMFEAGRLQEARRLCSSALGFFSRLRLQGKAAICEIVLARIESRHRRFAHARAACRSALRRLASAGSPSISFHAHQTHGDIEEALGNRAAALRAFQKAHAYLEDLRSNLAGEELKISILQDKLGIYESLVWLTLSGRGRDWERRAFTYIEQAKSRTLADLIAFQLSSLPAPNGNLLVEELRTRRKEMHACYRRIEALNAQGRVRTRETRALRERAGENEKHIESLIQELRASHAEFASVQENGTISLEQAQAAIPDDACILEYYETRGRLCACIITRDGLQVASLGDAAQARDAARLLQFQLSKFRLGPEYFDQHQSLLRQATDEHLSTLYRLLVEPLRLQVRGRSLVIVPHGFLHEVPFHALRDGDRYLIDMYSFSYAPSVSVFHLSRAKRERPGEQSLILGVPDAYAPHIAGEIEAVAASLPKAITFTGPSATVERLREYAPSSRFVHIATHGWFRQDNPMFSSVRLGTSEVRVYEFYELDLACDLITLSGCGTGLSTVVAGDELLGLVRGLLYAGARAVLVSLWDVSDASTAQFMEFFYRELAAHGDKSSALRAAMTRLRVDYPHPFFWAPFVLIGS